jgi:DNA-binding transcriptional LysR family regulator
VTEPYLVLFRPGHPIEQTDCSLASSLTFDWAVAGFDNSYQIGLPTLQRELLRRQGFPKYRVLNQSACIELAARSDVLTLLPATAAAPLIATGKFSAMPFPGGANFSISAVTSSAGMASNTVVAFIDAIRGSLTK